MNPVKIRKDGFYHLTLGVVAFAIVVFVAVSEFGLSVWFSILAGILLVTAVATGALRAHLQNKDVAWTEEQKAVYKRAYLLRYKRQGAASLSLAALGLLYIAVESIEELAWLAPPLRLIWLLGLLWFMRWQARIGKTNPQ